MTVSKFLKGILFSAAALFTVNTSAALWNVTSVNGVNAGDDARSRLFHVDKKSGSTEETYAHIMGISTGKSSTYDDVSGAFDIWIDIEALSGPSKPVLDGSYNVTGNLLFNKTLISDSVLTLRKSSTSVGDQYVINSGISSYGSAFGANVFEPLMNGTGIMALNGLSSDALRGLDVSFNVLNTSAVPLPAAAWFFGSALLGVFGLRRRQ